METKTDQSYGVIPVFKEPTGEWTVLLVHQISYRGDSFWILPKGHAEAGEDEQQAALRELQEEAGVNSVSLMLIDPIRIQYSFEHDGTKINKTVSYYVGICESKATKVTQPKEIRDIRWCSFDEAYRLASHTNTKEVLNQTEALLPH